MLFKATVNASKVAATLTDYPAYIDLSQMPASFWSTVANGGGDIRCYSDEAKTTELAREVVSCDTATDTGELHVKIPSLTTTTVIYIDVDGTRTEPAVGSTYGRNAVWSDYGIVTHDGGITDSTGNTVPKNVGVTTAAGKLGLTGVFNGSPDYVEYGHSSPIDVSTGDYHMSAWFKTDLLNSAVHHIFEKGYAGSTVPNMQMYISTDNKLRFGYESAGGSAIASAASFTLSTGTWYKVDGNADRDGNTTIYVNGVSQGTATGNASSIANSKEASIGVQRTEIAAFQNWWDGDIDEFRFRKSLVSDNWITTEHNNQSDVASFWTIAEVVSTGKFRGFFNMVEKT